MNEQKEQTKLKAQTPPSAPITESPLDSPLSFEYDRDLLSSQVLEARWYE